MEFGVSPAVPNSPPDTSGLAWWRSTLRALLFWRRPAPRHPPPLGARGEEGAARWLSHAGYRILARNVRVKPGEIDLIALDPDGVTLVFVEVKTRSKAPTDAANAPESPIPIVQPFHAQGSASAAVVSDGPAPEAAMTARKRAALARSIHWLARANSWEAHPRRIDVIAVEWTDAAPAFRHFRGAVGDLQGP